MSKPILIVDDEKSVRRLLQEIVRQAGYDPAMAETGEEAIVKADLLNPAAILMDIRMPAMDGIHAFDIIHKKHPQIPVILMTAYGTPNIAMNVVKNGAFDYLIKPSSISEIRNVLARAVQSQTAPCTDNKEMLHEPFDQHRIVGNSMTMQYLFKELGKVAPTNSTVLITGESGTGKELIAKTIHENSFRKDAPFIKVNCGAIPESLMESEFFGYEKGAFTGALTRKLGRFDLANHGTLFLDEVGELPLALQVKLLRVLQEREFERVGGTHTVTVDVRIIAATNRDVKALVKSGAMREDLYYRLNVVPIYVPPVREHQEDIPDLIEYFVRHFALEMNRKIPYVSPEALDLLKNYAWPGNVREIANVLERAVIMSSGIITANELPGLTLENYHQDTIDNTGTLKEIIQKVEKEVIEKTLRETGGNKTKTCQILKISRRALLYKIDQYQLTQFRGNVGDY